MDAGPGGGLSPGSGRSAAKREDDGPVVERTFAWLTKHRRLSKCYEYLPETSEAFIHVAVIGLVLRRLA